jgi:hypothetical protein
MGVIRMPDGKQRRRSNGHGSRAPPPDMANSELLDDLVETGQNDQLTTPLRNLLSRDFPLANLRRMDQEYIRLLSDNIALYAEEQFPPAKSMMQGRVGAMYARDPDYNREALSDKKKNEIRSTLITLFTRSSRGIGGWQQDKINEAIQVRRVEDDRQEEDETNGIIESFLD